MTANKDNRRGFLAKFSLGLLSMLGLNSLNGQSETSTDDAPDPNPVLDVKPMGFSWETLDPFLFCVHHEDKFPQANEVAIFNLKLEPGATFTLPAAGKGINRSLYFYMGAQITLAGKTIDRYHSVVVQADAGLDIVNTGPDEARILVLQGRPIGELVIQYGPFVMNTKEEIQQAFEDYHATQFGGWPWNRYDQVHARAEGRFARHADGTYEPGV